MIVENLGSTNESLKEQKIDNLKNLFLRLLEQFKGNNFDIQIKKQILPLMEKEMKKNLVKFVPIVGKIFNHIKGDKVYFARYGDTRLDSIGVNKQINDIGAIGFSVNPPLINDKGLIILNVGKFITSQGKINKRLLTIVILEEGWHLLNPENKNFEFKNGGLRLLKNEKYIKEHIASEINSALFSMNIKKLIYKGKLPNINNEKDINKIINYIEKVIDLELIPTIGKTKKEIKNIYFHTIKSFHPKINTFNDAIKKGLDDVRK